MCDITLAVDKISLFPHKLCFIHGKLDINPSQRSEAKQIS